MGEVIRGKVMFPGTDRILHVLPQKVIIKQINKLSLIIALLSICFITFVTLVDVRLV